MGDQRRPPKRRAWEAELPQWQRAELEEEQQAQRVAGEGLFKHLLGLYALCKLSAQDLCVALHYANLAGVGGAEFDRYAMPPGMGSGRYQRHLDRVLPNATPMYDVRVPVTVRSSGARETRMLPCSPPHEALAREVSGMQALQQTIAETVLPPVYHEHHLVRDARQNGLPLPVPLALYCDGVRYTAPLAGRSDSIVGIWAINLLSSKRHLLATVRSRDMCRCGCRGWDTLFPVWQMVAWSLEALARGRRPDARHDGSPWPGGVGQRGPAELGFTACVVWIKGDWAEVAHTLGLPACVSKHCPCPFCVASKHELHSRYRAMSTAALPHQPREDLVASSLASPLS